MFQDAKDAENALNTCPVEAIRRFIKRSCGQMSGKAAPKPHSGPYTSKKVIADNGCVSRTPMMHLDTVLNGS